MEQSKAKLRQVMIAVFAMKTRSDTSSIQTPARRSTHEFYRELMSYLKFVRRMPLPAMIPVTSAVLAPVLAPAFPSVFASVFEADASPFIVPLMPVAIAAPVIAPGSVLPPVAPFDARGPRPTPFIPPPCAVVPKDADAAVPPIVDRTLVPRPFDKDRRAVHGIAASRRTIAGTAEHQTDIAGIE
jgi:hypothetical protein